MLTFHKLIVGCAEGEGEAWRAFLTDYSPALLRLTEIYVAGQCNPAIVWQGTLDSLCTENFKQLRSIEHQSEPEFLAGLRSVLMDQAVASVHPQNPSNSPELTSDRLRRFLKDLPLLHQELVFLKLAGYSDPTLEAIFRITPAAAQKSVERLPAEFGYVSPHNVDACLFPAAWLQLQKQARTERAEACPPLRRFVQIQDGQAGWYDKEPAETHLASCLHCLEAWTGLREVKHWRIAAPPIPADEVEKLLARLPVQQRRKRAKPLFKRMFG